MTIPLTHQQLFSNNAVSLLFSSITATDTSLTVIPGHGALFPQPSGLGQDFFLITLEDQSASIREIIKVTGRAGDTLYFSLADRGLEGTSIRDWSSSPGNETLVDHRVTAETMQRAMILPLNSAETTWINGGNSGPSPLTLGWNTISSTTYSDFNRTFKFIITILMPSTGKTSAFEVFVLVDGLLNMSETCSWNRYSQIGSSFQGVLDVQVNALTQELYLKWQNNETQPVFAQCTRIQHT